MKMEILTLHVHQPVTSDLKSLQCIHVVCNVFIVLRSLSAPLSALQEKYAGSLYKPAK